MRPRQPRLAPACRLALALAGGLTLFTPRLAAAGCLLADSVADPAFLGGNTGCVFILDDGGNVTGWYTSYLFINPVDVLKAADGTIYILDDDADPRGWGGRPGAIFKIPPGSTEAVIHYDGPAFNNPTAFCLAPNGDLLVADSVADPLSLGGNVGTVFRITPDGQSSVFASTYDFVDPVDVQPRPGGGYIVADLTANPLMALAGGALFEVTEAGEVSVLVSNSTLADPWSVISDGAGGYMLADEDAEMVPWGPLGGVYRVSPTGDLTVIAQSLDFIDPWRIAAAPGGGWVVVDRTARHPLAQPSLATLYLVHEDGQIEVWPGSPIYAKPHGIYCDPDTDSSVPGDIDGDGDVDLIDFTTFAVCVGVTVAEPTDVCPVDVAQVCDLNGDGVVNLVDFTSFAVSFGQGR